MPLQHIKRPSVGSHAAKGGSSADRRVDRPSSHEESIPWCFARPCLAGFPGETEAQFEELLEFVERRRFERLGAFAFCSEPGTPAETLDGHLSEDVKHARRDRLMAAQQEIAFAWNASQVGRRLDVMIDGQVVGEPNAYVGRSYADAPEIDGQVFVTGEGFMPGQIVSCEIVATNGYDLIGVP